MALNNKKKFSYIISNSQAKLAAKIWTRPNIGSDRMYNFIFFTNILKILEERGMSKKRLAELSGVSESFMSDLTKGKGNPSLRIMESISNALEMPLSVMLEETDMNMNDLAELSEGEMISFLPQGFERVSVVLSERQAYIVKKWADKHKKSLNTLRRQMKNKK